MTPRELGARLREEREKQDLTRAALERRAHVSVSIIGKVERNTESAPLREILAVASALGLDVDLTIAGTSPEEAAQIARLEARAQGQNEGTSR